MTKPLTWAAWRKIGAASLRWAEVDTADQFRKAVEDVVRDRMKLAYRQGYNQGWEDGVNDANGTDEPPIRRPNPYEAPSE